MKSPKIDPIRDKVNFSTQPPSARLLVLDEKPTPKEAESLLACSSLRAKCADIFRAATADLPLPSGMAPEIKQRAKDGLDSVVEEDQRGVNYLIVALYGQRITYGEFNKERQDLEEEIAAENRAWVDSWTAQDKAVTMQKAVIAQQQADAAIAVVRLRPQ